MFEQLKAFLQGMVEDDEFFEIVAKGMKKSYDALLKAGFTEDQAIKIVAGQGIGVKAG